MDPDSKVHGANMGPIWGRQDPGGPMLVPWTLLSGMDGDGDRDGDRDEDGDRDADGDGDWRRAM